MPPQKKVVMGSTPPVEEEQVVDPVVENEVDPTPEQADAVVDQNDEDFEPFTLEDLDPDTALWIDGPLVKEVLKWKQEYGDIYITNVTMEKHVVWRTLRRSEYKQLVRTIENLIQTGKMTQTEAGMYNEELTVEICSLFPKYKNEDFDNDLAGIPAIISQQILESSGFTTIDVRML